MTYTATPRVTDYLFIGEAPFDEDCLPVDAPGQKEEAKRFMRQIEKAYPPPHRDADVALRLYRNDHDFGTYYSVIAVYNPLSKIGTDWAIACEADEKGLLRNWSVD